MFPTHYAFIIIIFGPGSILKTRMEWSLTRIVHLALCQLLLKLKDGSTLRSLSMEKHIIGKECSMLVSWKNTFAQSKRGLWGAQIYIRKGAEIYFRRIHFGRFNASLEASNAWFIFTRNICWCQNNFIVLADKVFTEIFN